MAGPHFYVGFFITFASDKRQEIVFHKHPAGIFILAFLLPLPCLFDRILGITFFVALFCTGPGFPPRSFFLLKNVRQMYKM